MNIKNPYFDIKDDIFLIKGEWVLEQARNIIENVNAQSQTLAFTEIDADTVQNMDSWGAYYLKKLAQDHHATLKASGDMQKLLEFLPIVKAPKISSPPSLFVTSFEVIGEKSSLALDEAYGILNFIGLISIQFVKNFAHPKSFRFHSIIRHIDETGIRAIPIIGLLAVLISMVVSYQAATQLQKFGANIFTIDLTVISLLREMGVLVTAIMVAGRSGSAFAAELGVMKLREEVDALRTFGMNPFEVLILPRIIALMITLPILTFIADIVGLAGGSLISSVLLDIPLDQYIDRVHMVAKPTMFFVGMIKAPVFAFVIATIGTYQGMNITGSAESVGRLTTVSVVQAIFLVIMIDAFFSILFAQMGI